MEPVIHNRIELAKYFAALGFTKGAEIGVLEGHYSEILLNTIPSLDLWCIDNWKNIANREQIEHKARDVLLGRATIIGKHSMDALEDFEDGELDFVYIDANHQYHSVLDDITGWAKKVRPGGIIAGDDYFDIPGSKWGVVKAVKDYWSTHQTNDGYLHTTEWDFNQDIEDTHPQWWFFK